MAFDEEAMTSATSGSQSNNLQNSDLILIKPKSQVVTTSLDEDNYVLWKYQVEIALKGYDLHDYVAGTKIIPPIMITDKEGKTVSNPDYKNYQKQDNLLSSWLLSSISQSLLSQMVGCSSSYKIWSAIERIYSSQSAAKVM
jgi:hypothetical protein